MVTIMRTSATFALIVTLLSVSTVQAMSFTDVPKGAWYDDAVDQFSDAGYIFTDTDLFRPNEDATRAEFIKLIVELNGGILSGPNEMSFTDVEKNTWYFGYFEDAAVEGWVRGDGNCYGEKPCYVRPHASISRAEAATLIVRSFDLSPTGQAGQFVDNDSNEWYAKAIQTAADHCVLAGDDATGTVRPNDNMNRAEMVVMLHRIDQGFVGFDCANRPNS